MARNCAVSVRTAFVFSCLLLGLLVEAGFSQSTQPAAPQNQTPAPAAAPAAGQQPPADPVGTTPKSGEAAQPSPPAPASATPPNAPEPVTETPYKRKNERIFKVIPNYRTVEDEGKEPTSLTTKEKFILGFKDSFDPYAYPTAGIFAGIAMAKKSTPSFGQGAAGFGRYFGTAFADETIGNMMSESIFPSMLHQDPRYFPMGRGHGFWKRLGYSVSREWRTRGDNGKSQFNFSELGGNAAAVAISNAYYPAENRNASDNASKYGQQIALDAFFFTLKEFWPDIRQKVFGK